MAQSNAVAARPRTDIKAMLHDENSSWGKELAKVLPSPKMVGRFMSVCLGQLSDPKVGTKLAQCTPASFYNCVLKSARNDIMPDGVNAFLIPYGSVCQLQISAKGMCDWLKRHKIVKDINGWVVYENDQFEMNMGKVTKHTFDFRNTERESEKVMGVWCRAILPDGVEKDMWIGVTDIEKIRKCAQSDANWSKWYDQMAIKSCIKRMCKTMENTPELADFLAVDNEEYDTDKVERTNRVKAADLLHQAEGDKGGDVIDIPTDDDPNDDHGPVGGGENDK